MARFFGKPSINDHIDDLIGSWFGKVPTSPVKDHESKPPHDDSQHHIPPHHDDGPDLPPVKDVIKFWLHKIFGGHHHNPPPDGNDAPHIIDAEQTGQIPEGDSTEALTAAGIIKFVDKDFGDTHTTVVEFVSTTDPSGMAYGDLVAAVGADAASSASFARGGYCPTPLTKEVAWTYAVNDADLTAPAGATILSIEVLGNDSDPDGDQLSIVPDSIMLPAGLIGAAVDSNGDGFFDTIEVRPAPGETFPDSFQFQYTVSDDHGGTDTATVSVTVPSANHAPDAVDDVVNATSATEPLTINVLDNDSDADGDQLSIVAGSIMLPAGVTGGAIDTNGDGFLNAIQLQPVTGETFPAAFEFQYTISDGRGGFDTATVSVTTPNTPPVANDDPVETGENVAVEIRLADLIANDTDANRDSLTVTAINGVALDDIDVGNIITLGSGATLVRIDETTFSYDPGTAFDSLNPGETAADQFSDSMGTVYAVGYAEGPIDDAPILSGKLDISDPDAGQDILSSGLLAQSTLGTFDYDSDGNWTFDLNEDYPGLIDLGANETLTVTYTLTSLDGTASQDVTITIERVELIHLDPNLAAMSSLAITEPVDPITTDPIATSSPATPIESGVGGTAAAETITTASLTTAAALSTDAPSPEPITIETTAVETASVATVEATSDPTPAVSSLGPIDFSVAADGLDFRPSLVRDGGSPGDGWLPDLGERLDTGLANVLHHALDRIGSDHPDAEHLASVLQSVVDRLDEPDHAVLDWLQSHLGAHMPDDAPFS